MYTGEKFMLEYINHFCDSMGCDYYQFFIVMFIIVMYIIVFTMFLYSKYDERKKELKALKKIDREAWLLYQKKRRTRQLIPIYLILGIFILPFVLSMKMLQFFLKQRHIH